MLIRFFEAALDIWRDPIYRSLMIGVASILSFGTVFYTIVEDWSVLDSLYFSVVTLTTIGYGDFAPKTALGKAVTIVYIFAGLGIIATFIGTVADRMSNEGTILQKFRTRRRAAKEKAPEGEEVDV